MRIQKIIILKDIHVTFNTAKTYEDCIFILRMTITFKKERRKLLIFRCRSKDRFLKCFRISEKFI